MISSNSFIVVLFLETSNVDRHRFDAYPDLDPTFHFDADQDPNPDPTPKA